MFYCLSDSDTFNENNENYASGLYWKIGKNDWLAQNSKLLKVTSRLWCEQFVTKNVFLMARIHLRWNNTRNLHIC